MKIFLAHASAFDFRNKLYIPLRASVLNNEHEFFFPQEEGKETVTKEVIQGVDVFIAEVSQPSTGAGIEMGWAHAAGVPIICIYEQGSVVSSAIEYVAQEKIEYENSDDLIAKLAHTLLTLDAQAPAV